MCKRYLSVTIYILFILSTCFNRRMETTQKSDSTQKSVMPPRHRVDTYIYRVLTSVPTFCARLTLTAHRTCRAHAVDHFLPGCPKKKWVHENVSFLQCLRRPVPPLYVSTLWPRLLELTFCVSLFCASVLINERHSPPEHPPF